MGFSWALRKAHVFRIYGFAPEHWDAAKKLMFKLCRQYVSGEIDKQQMEAAKREWLKHGHAKPTAANKEGSSEEINGGAEGEIAGEGQTKGQVDAQSGGR